MASCNTEQLKRRVTDLLRQDPMRIKALECVYKLALPDCYIAAGFVRNMVWDHLYRFSLPTPLKDVDVIYFNLHQCSSDADRSYQDELQQLMPAVDWQVKNQARMHLRLSLIHI